MLYLGISWLRSSRKQPWIVTPVWGPRYILLRGSGSLRCCRSSGPAGSIPHQLHRSEASEQTWESILACLAKNQRTDIAAVSLMELAALKRYAETRPVADWASLAPEEKRRYAPTSIDEIQSSFNHATWQPYAELYGMPLLRDRGEPMSVEQLEDPAKELLQSLLSVFPDFPDGLSDVKPEPDGIDDQNVKTEQASSTVKQQTPSKQIKRQLDESPEHAAIYSDSHWAQLLATREGQAVYYDGSQGLQKQVCHDNALSHVAELVELGWLETQPRLTVADVSLQAEAWSCGHRAALTLEYVLRLWMKDPGQLPASVPETIFEAVALKSLFTVCNSKQPPVPPSTPPRRTSSALVKTSPAASSGSTPRARVSKLAGSMAKKLQKQKQAQQAEDKKTKRQLKELQRRGAEFLEVAEITHGTFMSLHQTYFRSNTRPGHWQAFLEAVAEEDRNLDCRACAELRARARGSEQPPAAPAPAAPAAIVAAELDGEDQPIVLGSEDRQRNKGRKKKVDNDGRTWLHRFIKEERSTVYRTTDKSYRPEVEYHCLACQCRVRFWTASNPSKLQQHESFQKHARGLARLRNEQQTRDQALVLLETAKDRCCGIAAEDMCRACIEPFVSHPWAEHVVASRVASSQDTTGPLHPFRESLNHFVQSGQPVMLYDAGEADPFQGVVFEYCGQRGTVVSSRLCRKGESCQRELDRGYCDECLRACSSKPMRKQVLKLSYWV